MGSARLPVVIAHFIDENSGTRGMCYCAGRPGTNSFTIPAAVLAYFPPAARGVRVQIAVVAWPMKPTPFQATGLDHAIAAGAFMQIKSWQD